MQLFYLDTSSATKKVLKDWYRMTEILGAPDGEIEEIQRRMDEISEREQMQFPTSNTCENDESSSFDIAKTLALEAKKRAKQYFEWLLPAWLQLTPLERYCLQVLYIDYDVSIGISQIMNRLNCGKSYAYDTASAALKHLAALLFWPSSAA